MTPRPRTRTLALIASIVAMLCMATVGGVRASDAMDPVFWTLDGGRLGSTDEIAALSERTLSLSEGDGFRAPRLLGGGEISLLPRDDRPADPEAGARPIALDERLSRRAKARSTESDRDWAGIGRDTALLLGYETVLGVPLYLMTDGADKAQPKAMMETWWDNVRHPHWDADPWVVNYVGHPYVGAAYYIRARERGFGRATSFLYAALLSTAFEYGVESLFEPPSYQDLIVTPVAGAAIGAFIFEPLRNRIKAKPERAWHDRVILMVTDPVGAINGVFEWLFGITPDLQLQLRPLPAPYDGAARPSKRQEGPQRQDRGLGLQFTVRY
jgi:hypothetical protein